MLSISVLSAPVLHSSSSTNASVVFMVDWQFTVFCREVGFVIIYAFFVLFFVAIYVSVLFKSLFATLPAGPGYLKLEARRTFLKYSAWLVIHAKVLLCIEHQRISTSRFNTICSFFRSSIRPHHPYMFAEVSPLSEVWWGHCMTN